MLGSMPLPEAGAQCVSSARWDLCGGPAAMSVPTAIMACVSSSCGPAALVDPAAKPIPTLDPAGRHGDHVHRLVGPALREQQSRSAEAVWIRKAHRATTVGALHPGGPTRHPRSCVRFGHRSGPSASRSPPPASQRHPAGRERHAADPSPSSTRWCCVTPTHRRRVPGCHDPDTRSPKWRQPWGMRSPAVARWSSCLGAAMRGARSSAPAAR
jgi:hypothetical protein